eukprot:SAG31_NODE_339_length_17487_cov_20.764435_16_plen_78_part_00
MVCGRSCHHLRGAHSNPCMGAPVLAHDVCLVGRTEEERILHERAGAIDKQRLEDESKGKQEDQVPSATTTQTYSAKI